MKLNNKVTNASSTEEFALTDTELETVLGGQGSCTPYGGGSSPYYSGGSSPYYDGSSSCGNSSYAPNYGSSFGSNSSPFDSGSSCGGSTTYSVTTYYTGSPVSGSSCGGY